MDEVQDVVAKAIGGENVTTTVQGRERYPVNVRYMRDFRAGCRRPGPRARCSLRRTGTGSAFGAGDYPRREGPSMIRNEDGLLTGYVYVDITGARPERLHRRGLPTASGKR